MAVEQEFDPVIARLRFGELARRFREAARVELMAADRAMGGYPGKLSKIENGTIGPRPDDVEWMIGNYRLPSLRADEFRALATVARRRSTPAKNVGSSRQYVSLERRASEIRMAYNEIPGLLQTAEYARHALATSPVVAASDVEGLAEERANRGRRVIRQGGPQVWIVLGEDALHRANGGPDVLRPQLEHLREVARLPNVHLRLHLVSDSSGIVTALSNPFTMLRLDQGKVIVYVGSLTRPDYIKVADPYVAAFEQAWQTAASTQRSSEILGARIAELAHR
ncbi:helix-turn-helix transcriptional regulator [Actinosynnema sp. NPDC050436]|uniref:helix-turn-helix domain-containing protein n=1 Tax=Actinosynnema sp. NPDC050436 TaxID=3155659 RepID=UPI0033DAC50C